VDVAKRNVVAWIKRRYPGVRSTLEVWDIALNGSSDDIIELLTGEGERQVLWRQSNPFAGVLSNP